MSGSWPTYEFWFHTTRNGSDDDAMLMERFLESIADRRSWSIGPPELIDELEEVDGMSGFRIVGGALCLYEPKDRTGRRLGRARDEASHEDVKALVDEMQRFTRENDASVDCFIGPTSTGTIRRGVADDSITELLLGEWRRGLSAHGE